MVIAAGQVFDVGQHASSPSQIRPALKLDVSKLTIQQKDDKNIIKINPAVTWPTGLTATYGETLENVDILGDSDEGTFSWTEASDTPVGNVGTQTHSMTFTPTEDGVYATVYKDIAVEVAKASPSVTWPADLTATYGNTLANISISGGSGEGTFSWTEANDTLVGNVGTQTHSMTFTPTDTNNYEALTQEVPVLVSKASLIIPDFEKGILYTDGSTQTVNIAELVSEYKLDEEELTYQLEDVTGASPTIIQNPSVLAEGILSFGITGSVDDTATIPVTVSGLHNYNDTTVHVTVTLTDKTPLVVTLNVQDKTYDGNSAEASATAGTIPPEDFTYMWMDENGDFCQRMPRLQPPAAIRLRPKSPELPVSITSVKRQLFLLLHKKM